MSGEHTRDDELEEEESANYPLGAGRGARIRGYWIDHVAGCSIRLDGQNGARASQTQTRWCFVTRAQLFVVAALSLPGCFVRTSDLEEWTLQAKMAQAAVTVDFLFVIDNSPSMAEESASVGLAANTFTQAADDAGLLWRLAMTTPSVDYSGGESGGVEPGEAGLFVGDWGVIDGQASDTEDHFRHDLLCNVAYWRTSAVPSDSAYVCDQSEPETPNIVSQQYLDCLCGTAAWEDNSVGSGDEEPLEAGLMALCRAAPEPPEACFDALSPFNATQEISNDDWYRDEGAIVVVTFSDEGDNSRRMAQVEADPDVYIDAFASFDKPVVFASMALDIDETSGGPICPTTTVPVWSLQRMMNITDATGGIYEAISAETDGGDCVAGDIAGFLTDLVDVANL